MSDTLLRVSRIQKFCTHDGPGIRTTVFLKGCPLRCAWCHNPETQSPRAGILFSEKLCVLCGGCAAVCPNGVHAVKEAHTFDISKCAGCGKCTALCPTGALEADSTEMTVDQIMNEVLRDRAFYGTLGGLTLSGGEPMLQGSACIELLRAAKEAGITTAIETCGFFDSKLIPELATVTDFFLWDFKDSDQARHRRYTGQSNRLITENLRLLDAFPVNLLLRCIMVEGVNMTDEHAAAIADLSASLNHCQGVELIPYHAYGVSKAVQAGMSAEPHREWIPSAQRMQAFARRLRESGVAVHEK